jgi:hypothetical protein
MAAGSLAGCVTDWLAGWLAGSSPFHSTHSPKLRITEPVALSIFYQTWVENSSEKKRIGKSKVSEAADFCFHSARMSLVTASRCSARMRQRTSAPLRRCTCSDMAAATWSVCAHSLWKDDVRQRVKLQTPSATIEKRVDNQICEASGLTH